VVAMSGSGEAFKMLWLALGGHLDEIESTQRSTSDPEITLRNQSPLKPEPVSGDTGSGCTMMVIAGVLPGYS
jgi:hypothetical protein